MEWKVNILFPGFLQPLIQEFWTYNFEHIIHYSIQIFVSTVQIPDPIANSIRLSTKLYTYLSYVVDNKLIRGCDIIVIDTIKSIRVILDSTATFQIRSEQPEDINEEKVWICKPKIPNYEKKYQIKLLHYTINILSRAPYQL